MTSTYTYPVPRTVLEELVHLATRMREISGEPFSLEVAIISRMLDLDRGTTPTRSDYARIWGWTYDQIRYRWAQIDRSVDEWRSAFGRLDSCPTASPIDSQGIPTERRESAPKPKGRPKASPPEAHSDPTLYYPTLNSNSQPTGQIHICSEAVPATELVASLPMIGGGELVITKAFCVAVQEIYPAVDIEGECRGMLSWCIGNRRKLKTRDGIMRFVTSWLARNQNRGGSREVRETRPTDPYGLLPLAEIRRRKATGAILSYDTWEFYRTAEGAVLGRQARPDAPPIPEAHARLELPTKGNGGASHVGGGV